MVTGPPGFAVTTTFEGPEVSGDEPSWQAVMASAHAITRHAMNERKQDVGRMNSILPKLSSGTL
jgi:hypothetical protein